MSVTGCEATFAPLVILLVMKDGMGEVGGAVELTNGSVGLVVEGVGSRDGCGGAS